MKKKNVLILYTDQQRYDSLGCTGNLHAVTPHLDALAQDGALFTRHIAANPACMPSRASFFTGMSTFGHGVTDNGIALWRNEKTGGVKDICNEYSMGLRGKPFMDAMPTIADILKDNGYRTASFGKLHFTPLHGKKHFQYEESQDFWETPEAENFTGPYYGFDEILVAISHGESPCAPNNGHYGRWMQREHPEVFRKVMSGEYRTEASETCGQIYLSPIPSEIHHSMWLADEACGYIKKHKDDEQPNFLYIGFPDPHHPFTPPADFAALFPDMECMEPAPGDERIRRKPKAVQTNLEQNRVSPEDARKAAIYTNISVALIDRAVGKIVDCLKVNGLYEDTVILFSSDHGDFMGDYGALWKSWCVSHNLVHVPFIFKGCGSDRVTGRINTPMSNYDVLPTLLKLLGIEKPYYMQGVDIFSKEAECNSPISGTCTPALEYTNFSIYNETYRYAFYPHTGEEELYNHEKDPMELDNLAFDKSPEHEVVCREMRQELMEKHLKYDTHLYGYHAIY